MNIKGKISHCDTELRAGQRKAARGYVGLTVEDRPVFDEAAETSLAFEGFLTFRRGLCGKGPAIVTRN